MSLFFIILVFAQILHLVTLFQIYICSVIFLFNHNDKVKYDVFQIDFDQEPA